MREYEQFEKLANLGNTRNYGKFRNEEGKLNTDAQNILNL